MIEEDELINGNYFLCSKWPIPTGMRTQEAADGLHQAPNPRVRKGVPLQSVSYEEEEDRDRPLVVSIGEADQDLVPEQTNEVEEGQQITQH